MKSIKLDHCWVCETRFTDANPPGTANREEHHIVPRQAGGSNGPTVSLCDKHHTILHKIAATLNSKKPKPYGHLIADLDPGRQKKVLYLAGVAANAFAQTKDDPNKRRVVVLTMDRETEDLLNRLKACYPKVRSREALVKLALQSLVNRHYQ